ncbi:MAG TPA: CarD family transcriptional regulator [Acidobacteriota bacterium]|nr:CarD family transcriptional regulator [Acidobacteriota bacterium]
MSYLSIGDKIIYPNQGIGIVEDIQKQKLYGEESRVFRLRIVSNDTLVLIPFSSIREMGIRKLVSEEKIEKIYNFMRNGIVDISKNWKGRHKEHEELMKTGSLLDIAFVIKSLYYLNLTKPLSFREKKMMEKAKELLVSEISEVINMTEEEVEERVFKNLSICFKDIIPRVDS